MITYILVTPFFFVVVANLREELENCTSLECVRLLHCQNQQLTNECVRQLGTAFKLRQLDQARELTVRLQYLTKISLEAEDKEERLIHEAALCVSAPTQEG